MLRQRNLGKVLAGLVVWLAVISLLAVHFSPRAAAHRSRPGKHEGHRRGARGELPARRTGRVVDAPTKTPRDYRVNWARVGERFPTWTDLSGNAFPTSSSYTITGLDEGVRYKVKVRARFNGFVRSLERTGRG